MKNVLVLFSLLWMCRSELLENNDTSGATVDAEDLIELGRTFNKPFVTLIGQAMLNLHPCEQWTQWSPCAARLGYFGRRNRSRICYYNSNKTTVNEGQLCEGFCPVGYNITKHGYCIKLNLQKATHDDAEIQCRLQGGHMINIETQQKYDDVKQIVNGYNEHVRVGGRRANVSSPWLYEYGSPNGFLVWYSGQPDNIADQLCLTLNNWNRLWHDYQCLSILAFLCEVTEEAMQ